MIKGFSVLQSGLGEATNLTKKFASSVGIGSLTNEKQIINANLKEKIEISPDQKIENTNKLIDHIFLQSEHDIPKEFRKAKSEDDEEDFEDLCDEYFKSLGFGTNVFSKKNNKYLYKLMQIFGFRNESLISLFDKDHMKESYLKCINKSKYPPNQIEYFLVTYGIQRLA